MSPGYWSATRSEESACSEVSTSEPGAMPSADRGSGRLPGSGRWLRSAMKGTEDGDKPWIRGGSHRESDD